MFDKGVDGHCLPFRRSPDDLPWDRNHMFAETPGEPTEVLIAEHLECHAGLGGRAARGEAEQDRVWTG